MLTYLPVVIPDYKLPTKKAALLKIGKTKIRMGYESKIEEVIRGKRKFEVWLENISGTYHFKVYEK